MNYYKLQLLYGNTVPDTKLEVFLTKKLQLVCCISRLQEPRACLAQPPCPRVSPTTPTWRRPRELLAPLPRPLLLPPPPPPTTATSSVAAGLQQPRGGVQAPPPHTTAAAATAGPTICGALQVPVHQGGAQAQGAAEAEGGAHHQGQH